MHKSSSNFLSSLLTLFLSVAIHAQAEPRVVTSIKPLHLVATELMAGVAEPVLLLKAETDPHHYSMKLSERRQLGDADILLWIGPDLELSLSGLVPQLGAEIITSSELPLPRMIDHDPHLWLDAGNVAVIAEALAASLSVHDPDHQAAYKENLDQFLFSLHRADELIAAQFTDNRKAFAVYHDAYSYFEQRYGLAHSISLTGHEAVSPGVQQVLQFRTLAEEDSIRCIITEPGVSHVRLNNLLETNGLTMTAIDPVWHGITEETRYAEYLQGVANSLESCLTGATQ